MLEPVDYPSSQERIEAQTRSNLNALMLVGVAYAKAQGQEIRQWATFVGKAFAPGWTPGMTPRQAAVATALNCASCGMRVVAVEGDEARAEAVAGDWPDPEDLEFFKVSQAEVDQFWAVFEPIAQSLGLTYTWRRAGDQLHFTFAK